MPMPINPIRSAKIRTHDAFSFKYGKVEVSAKLPTGDWLLPGIDHSANIFFKLSSLLTKYYYELIR